MVVIAGHYRVDEDQRDEVITAFEDLVRRARAADGALHIAITADSADPERVNMIEVWRDAEALDRWRQQANCPDVDVEMRDMHIARYTAREGGPLFD